MPPPPAISTQFVSVIDVSGVRFIEPRRVSASPARRKSPFCRVQRTRGNEPHTHRQCGSGHAACRARTKRQTERDIKATKAAGPCLSGAALAVISHSRPPSTKHRAPPTGCGGGGTRRPPRRCPPEQGVRCGRGVERERQSEGRRRAGELGDYSRLLSRLEEDGAQLERAHARQVDAALPAAPVCPAPPPALPACLPTGAPPPLAERAAQRRRARAPRR